MSAISPTVSVLIPTWRRPDELAVCLAALRRQTKPADQVVVTVREDDDITHARLEQLEREGSLPAGFHKVTVGPLPLTASMNAGLAVTTGDLVALTDDDAEPWADWLERLYASFSDPTIGGVGGRDWLAHALCTEPIVGIVSWYGRTVGNHHAGVGEPRDVDLLKGVNCCFRGNELRGIGFDRRLRGKGNVSHWEMSLCFAFRRAGWRLIYDPAICVEHRPAVRHDGDVNARGGFDVVSFVDGMHNETLSLLTYLPPARKLVFLGWAAFIGTSGGPGLGQIARQVVRRRTQFLLRRWWATLAGRILGVQTFLKT